MNTKLIDYARAVSLAASQGRLDGDHAVMFCQDAVPLLLAEIEVGDLLNQRFDAMLQAAQDQPEPQPVPEPVEKKAAKKPRRKARRK